jgi:hypothetical protein
MIVALVGVALGLGGVAFATIPDSSGTIHGCYGRKGKLRVVKAGSNCRRNETAIEWNQRGPRGAIGPTGATGASGGWNVVAAEETSEVSTASDTHVDLGGPTLTVVVPATGLIELYARADLKGEGDFGGEGTGQEIALFEDGNFKANAIRCSPCGNRAYGRHWVSPGIGGGGFGTFQEERAAWNLLEATPGSHTYSLRYRSYPFAQSDTAFFRNRKFWIGGVAK